MDCPLCTPNKFVPSNDHTVHDTLVLRLLGCITQGWTRQLRPTALESGTPHPKPYIPSKLDPLSFNKTPREFFLNLWSFVQAMLLPSLPEQWLFRAQFLTFTKN